jgi:hypothetical protein
MALASMGDQFRGLPMADLIGGPLMAASDAQIKLANATADFIRVVGFAPPKGNGAQPTEVRTVRFMFDRPAPMTNLPTNGATATPMESVLLEVPLLAVVKVPSLAINAVDVVFDMEVKNSETDKESFDLATKFDAAAKVGWGPFSLSVNISGSVASHKENTRQSDQSAKYHVQVHAEDRGMPEGLARVLDIVQSSVAPKEIKPVQAAPK